jgi:hypothetical protein
MDGRAGRRAHGPSGSRRRRRRSCRSGRHRGWWGCPDCRRSLRRHRRHHGRCGDVDDRRGRRYRGRVLREYRRGCTDNDREKRGHYGAGKELLFHIRGGTNCPSIWARPLRMSAPKGGTTAAGRKSFSEPSLTCSRETVDGRSNVAAACLIVRCGKIVGGGLYIPRTEIYIALLTTAFRNRSRRRAARPTH